MILKSIMKDIIDYLILKNFQNKWLKIRGNNFTRVGNVFPVKAVSIDDFTYGTLNVYYYNHPEEKLTIGRFCSIANDVRFYTGGGHDFYHATTYPFKNRVSHNKIQEATTKGPITIRDDVWIGSSCIILSGVTIGQGAVIGAGSIVAKDVPAYAIYCGDKVKKYRFNESIRKELMTFDLSEIDYNTVGNKLSHLYTHITEENVQQILDNLRN